MYWLGILGKDWKIFDNKVTIVFEIKLNTNGFIFRLLKKELDKIKDAKAKILKNISISFLEIQLLAVFLCFCFQAAHLGQIFI